MLPIALWPVRVQGIGEDMPSNMLSFINFEPLELYWTYFLALQTMAPKIPPMRLMSLDHELKMRCCAMSSNYGLWWDYITMSFGPWALTSFCEYGLFWALKEVFPKSMILLTWCELPMKWSYVVWKICPQQKLIEKFGTWNHCLSIKLSWDSENFCTYLLCECKQIIVGICKL